MERNKSLIYAAHKRSTLNTARLKIGEWKKISYAHTKHKEAGVNKRDISL